MSRKICDFFFWENSFFFFPIYVCEFEGISPVKLFFFFPLFLPPTMVYSESPGEGMDSSSNKRYFSQVEKLHVN